MPDTYYKFKGASQAVDDDATMQIGDTREVTLQVECVSSGVEKRADGERRPVIGLKVLEVDLGKVTEAPKDEQLPFDETGETDEDDAR